ncbi:hypothetical protein BpHYR1_004979 [Brachionus plicatilis]|uniref:Uncharacterized protein n=1 Tax=Brachionus plicatilis TaxID=10195 RepID=A0A3M7S3A8_BRAPC|nr:hypothetical protein BpHYR1_004979 [Brachionus plicatilis]
MQQVAGRYKRRSLFQEIRKTRKTRCQKIRKQEECQWRFLKLYIIEFTYNRITYNRISTVNMTIIFFKKKIKQLPTTPNYRQPTTTNSNQLPTTTNGRRPTTTKNNKLVKNSSRFVGSCWLLVAVGSWLLVVWGCWPLLCSPKF